MNKLILILVVVLALASFCKADGESSFFSDLCATRVGGSMADGSSVKSVCIGKIGGPDSPIRGVLVTGQSGKRDVAGYFLNGFNRFNLQSEVIFSVSPFDPDKDRLADVRTHGQMEISENKTANFDPALITHLSGRTPHGSQFEARGFAP